jgi:ABC-type phosphonate transport system ATPase subunit
VAIDATIGFKIINLGRGKSGDWKMPKLTDEQARIEQFDLKPGEILKVMAFAGTGKTTTLAAYAKARPDMRFLYVAFNKKKQSQLVFFKIHYRRVSI